MNPTILRNAGIEDFRIHDLRHQAATICMDNGEDIFIISKALGHKNLKTTTRYTNISAKPLRKAANLVQDIVRF